jgi:hypothetical protein
MTRIDSKTDLNCRAGASRAIYFELRINRVRFRSPKLDWLKQSSFQNVGRVCQAHIFGLEQPPFVMSSEVETSLNIPPLEVRDSSTTLGMTRKRSGETNLLCGGGFAALDQRFSKSAFCRNALQIESPLSATRVSRWQSA